MKLRTAWLAAVLLLAFLLPSSTAFTAEPTSLPDQLVLKLQPGLALAPDTAVAGQSGAGLAYLLSQVGASNAELVAEQTYRLTITSSPVAAARLLASHPAVVYAEPNRLRQRLLQPDDSAFSQQWALRNIQALAAWDITTGSDLIIAIVDTGVAADHPDLAGKVLPGYDFVSNDGDAGDDEGHGTAMAGVAAAIGNNGQGIAGVCWGCRILPVKVLNARGSGDDIAVAQGIRWAADQGARIINLSLGSPEQSQILADAVAYAHSRGALLVAASGNSRGEGNPINYPAAYPQVLAVAATTNNDLATGFSNSGAHVDLAAPGVGIWTTVIDPRSGQRTYGAGNGTSPAAPFVAGAAALAWSLRPDLSNEQIACLLTQSADDVGAPGRDDDHGAGRLNVLRAVQSVATFSCGATSTPAPPAVVAPPVGSNPAFAPITNPQDGRLYFGETGHTLRGAFRDYWQANGGLAVFGFPISEEFIETDPNGLGVVVQYFERHRFEFRPENQPPYHVLLSRLGDQTLSEQGRNWFSFPKTGPVAGCAYFGETGQSVCEPFLSAWRRYGLEFDGQPGVSYAESLALFGLPISPPQIETLSDGQNYTVQWFERGRFEDHGPQGVLFGLLSDELARRRGWR